MGEVRRCVVCNKSFVVNTPNKKCCSNECTKIKNRMNSARYNKEIKGNNNKTKKSLSFTDIAVKARQAGMSYGKYVAMLECGMKIEGRNI